MKEADQKFDTLRNKSAVLRQYDNSVMFGKNLR